VPGRIPDADIAAVRDRSPVADVVGEYVALRRAGGDSLKGLCPFHEEKTPSFHVRPSVGLYHCFGCDASGDVIDFIQRLEHLNFLEAVERLAGRGGVTLRYERGGSAPTRPGGGERARMLAANLAAAAFYTEQLAAADGKPAREFLAVRGFDADAAKTFGCGFAPGGWDVLTKHLLAAGFTTRELVTAGLSLQARSGSHIDRFRRRLVWPIRSLPGDVVGFGARKLFDDDDGPKYLNTPETPLYKKSEVLYGVDLAKREIARRRQAVVVEGYTDVMACHLAGVPTAIATCGTAFGSEHITVLRRLLMDSDSFRGEVIFTFDGDAAGRKAALRAFDDEQRFTSQTFVAVEPSGLDPCELRQAKGDAAVRDLVARRQPLFEFAIRSRIEDFDLDTTEGRLAALDAAAPIVAAIKDRGLRDRYAVALDRWLGWLDEAFILRRVAEVTNRKAAPARKPTRSAAAVGTVERPRADDPRLAVERESLKLAMQVPGLAGPVFDAVGADAYTHPVYVAIREAIAAAGGVQGASIGPGWVEQVRDKCTDDVTRSVAMELAVEGLRTSGDPDGRYVVRNLARLQELAVDRTIAQLRSRVQRINPVERADEYSRMFGELVTLEQHRRGLREQGMGE
jgi:DNA primase